MCTSSRVLLGVISASSRSSAVNSPEMFSKGRYTWRKLRTEASSHMQRSRHRGISAGASGSDTSGVTTRHCGDSSAPPAPPPAAARRRGRSGGGGGGGFGLLLHARGSRAFLGAGSGAGAGAGAGASSSSSRCCFFSSSSSPSAAARHDAAPPFLPADASAAVRAARRRRPRRRRAPRRRAGDPARRVPPLDHALELAQPALRHCNHHHRTLARERSLYSFREREREGGR